MEKRNKYINTQTFMFLSFLVLYASLSMFVEFFHDHDPDFQFHDNCPACQWEQQIQENHSEFETILERFLDVFAYPSYFVIFEDTPFYKQTDHTFYFSRAPPVS